MKFKSSILSIVFIGLVCFQSSAREESFVLEDIKITGLQRVATGAALTYLPVKVGDRVNAFKVAKLIRALHSSTHFDDIQISRDGNVLVVAVRERATISNIIYSGNDDIKDEQLDDSMKGNNIVVGEPLDKTLISSIETGLKDFYYGIGKYDADVSAIITPLPRNRVDLKIVFEEGEAAELSQINFVGNEAFDDEKLMAQMELQAAANQPWWKFYASSRYQKQKLTGDLETVRSYYMDRGYATFNIESTQVTMTPEKTGVYVTINIDEGEQYEVSEIELSGDLLGYEKILEKIIPMTTGAQYNLAQVTYTEEFINKYLAGYGYAYSKVTTIPEINEEDNTVKLTLNVDPGKRIYVRRIVVNGNEVTADEVLRRKIIQMEGSWLSNQSLDTSKLLISQLPYVQEVEFETNKVIGVEDQVDIDFNIKEQSSGAFTGGFGYGDFQGFNIQAGVQEANFLGSGKSLAFNVNTNKYRKSASINYVDPFWTIDGISLGGSITYSDFNASNANLAAYNREDYSIGATIGYPMNQFNRINFGTTLKHSEISRLSSYDQYQGFYDLYYDPSSGDTNIALDNLELSVGWSRTTLNRGTYPTDGSQQRLSARATVPGSDAQYYKFNMNSKFYFPLTQDHSFTFLTRFDLGYGNGYGTLNGNKQVLPFFENFTGGGRDSLRGFENNTVGPRGVIRIPSTSIAPDGTVIPVPGANDSLSMSFRGIGGNASFSGSLELIVPTPLIDEETSAGVRTSFFVDVGNVWDTNFDYDSYRDLAPSEFERLRDYSDYRTYRASAGLSVQWISPMGPMIFSFSSALKKDDVYDDTEGFSFNIGTTF